MARGKHHARKTHRDALQLAAEIARVQAQLDIELDRLAETKERARLDAQLRSDLTTAVAARDAACEPHLQRMRADRSRIRIATGQIHDADKPLQRRWGKIADWGWKEFGPEAFLALLTGNRPVVIEGVVRSQNLNATAAEVIQRARGLRHGSASKFSAEQTRMLGQVAAAAAGIDISEDALVADTEKGWADFNSRVNADAAARIAFQFPVPWLDTTFSTTAVGRALGAIDHSPPPTTTPPTTVASAVVLSAGTAAQRDAAVAAGATTAANALAPQLHRDIAATDNSQITTPLTDLPLYPTPRDAAALRTFYAAAALGTWGRHQTHTTGRIGVATAASVPFWLPPGHTTAYLDSDPLNDDDLADLRLPFAQVLLTFAEPVRLPPADESSSTTEPQSLQWIDATINAHNDTNALPSSREIAIAATQGLTTPRPTLWDALTHRGAHIEAVLLLADAHGNLDDMFAWCVRVPSTSSRAELGRWTIPASRTRTQYPNFVTNAAAVVAWADWHRPGTTRLDTDNPRPSPASNDELRRRKSGTDDAVHVLDIATTNADTTSAGTGTLTRPVTPHRRRGHWRRQRYGPGRTETRRVRIAPVLVNANKLGVNDTHSIYRLPTPNA